ncbi:MAG: right-handed parallel beta-helix repeat-containing protein [Brevinematia bacterium]
MMKIKKTLNFIVLALITFAINIVLFSCGATQPTSNSTPEIPYTIYVSKSGNDNNDGSTSNPFFSINKAISKAYELLSKSNYIITIKLGEGIYTNNDGLNPTITIFITNAKISLEGGWNSDFSDQTGITVIDLSNETKQGIVIKNTSDIEINNLSILNAKTYYSIGGGILIKDSSSITISNVIISNSLSSLGGGGIAIDSSSKVKLFVKLIGNTSYSSGGGILITNSYQNEIYGDIINNLSTQYGGGICIFNSSTNKVQSTITNNSASSGGGVALVETKSVDNEIYGNISLNSGSVAGGGVLFYKSKNSILSATIQGNSSPLGGGVAIQLPQGQIIITESVITNISSTGAKQSVIYISNSVSLTSLIIDKCKIAGTTSNPLYGIYEDGADISGHTISTTTFYTNTLSQLYHDPDGDIAITGISTLNTISTLHDATGINNIAANLP